MTCSNVPPLCVSWPRTGHPWHGGLPLQRPRDNKSWWRRSLSSHSVLLSRPQLHQRAVEAHCLVITPKRFEHTNLLVMSNWELMMVYNMVRNGSLWRNVVFEKEEKFTLKRLKPFIGIWICKQRWCLFCHILLQIRWPIGFKCSQICCLLWYTKWEYWSLTIGAPNDAQTWV